MGPICSRKVAVPLFFDADGASIPGLSPPRNGDATGGLPEDGPAGVGRIFSPPAAMAGTDRQGGTGDGGNQVRHIWPRYPQGVDRNLWTEFSTTIEPSPVGVDPGLSGKVNPGDGHLQSIPGSYGGISA